MRRSLPIIVSLALAAPLLAPSTSAAEDGVPVPNLEAPEASFAPSEGAVNTFVASGADRARMVAHEGILVTAKLGSKVEVLPRLEGAEQPIAIELLEGGFHLVVGSEPIDIELGDGVLRAVDSEVMAAKLGEVWIVQVKPATENGRVEQIPEAPAAPTAPGPDEAAAPTADAEEGAESAPAPPPAPEPVPLTEDKRHTLKGGELGKAERRESEFLLKTIARLVPGGTGSQPTGSTVAVLEPRPIEDPRDFVVVASGAEAAMSELEIEDIELDVGCVEICID